MEIVDLQEFSVVGSRSQFRAITDTPVPVSMIDIDEFENLGDTDMISMLATIIPSFNVNQQPISDAATLDSPGQIFEVCPRTPPWSLSMANGAIEAA